MNEATVRQKRVAGFLLGLGFGLVIGILFQPRDEYSRESAKVHKRTSHEATAPLDQVSQAS